MQAGEGAAGRRLLPVRQPRLRRRRLRPRRLPLRLGRATARASPPRTTGQVSNPCPATRPTRAGRCAARTPHRRRPARRRRQRSSGSTPPTASRPTATANADRTRRLRAAQPVAAHLPAAGTDELWSGDVGASNGEEVNRIADITTLTRPVNRGWPCYEGTYAGSARQPGWDALNMPSARTCTPQGAGAVQAPYFSYQTRGGGPLDTGRGLRARDLVGLRRRVRHRTSSNYPAAYQGALFFSDYARVVHLAAGQEAERRPRPDRDPALRAGRRDPGRPGHRPRRRPLLRRLRPRRRRRPDRGRGRHPPDRLHAAATAPRPRASPPTRRRAPRR